MFISWPFFLMPDHAAAPVERIGDSALGTANLEERPWFTGCHIHVLESHGTLCTWTLCGMSCVEAAGVLPP